ncbi:uncharacterized protein LOC105384521 [Plutella xylostella]|uniref:uncharacterized protein LOC105384521 n=1 Tax=Plutella xylostella TaxID=51655 RepID=UPI002032BE99|nr:uncharacterized protein LOC105384521 [Plutella xylostella]
MIKLLIFFYLWFSLFSTCYNLDLPKQYRKENDTFRFPNTTLTSRRLPRGFLPGSQIFKERDHDADHTYTGPQRGHSWSAGRGAPRLLGDACLRAPRPAPGRAGRLVVELLRRLEGPPAPLTKQLLASLVRAHVLVQTTSLDQEPTLTALVRGPAEMRAEPHASFPRVMAAMWLLLTDADSLAEDGWCKLDKLNDFLNHAEPKSIPAQLKRIDGALSRARYAVEEFIHNVVVTGDLPLRLYPARTSTTQVRTTTTTTTSTPAPPPTTVTTTTAANSTNVTTIETTTRRFQPTRPRSTRSRTTRTRTTTEPPNLPVKEQYIEGDDTSDIYLKQLFDSFPEIHISDYHETHLSNNQISENPVGPKIPDKSNDPKIRRVREPRMRSRSFQLEIFRSLIIFVTVFVL